MRLWPRRMRRRGWSSAGATTTITMSNASGTFVPSVPLKRIAFARDTMPSAEAVAEFSAAVAKNGVTSAQFAETVRGNAAAMFGPGETGP